MSEDRSDQIRVEDQRPTLVRTYGLVAWLALMLLAIAAGLVYRRVAVGRMTYELEGQAYAVAQRFATTTWPTVRAYARDAARIDPAVLRASDEVAEIGAGLRALAGALPLTEAEVIAEDGTVLFATDPNRIGSAVIEPTVLDILAGQTYGRGRADVISGRDGAIVTTYTAIRSSLRKVEAVVAIRQDGAARLRRIATIQMIGTGAGIGLSAVFLIVALASGRKGRER